MAATELPVEHLFSLTAEVGSFEHALVKRGPVGTRLVAPVVRQKEIAHPIKGLHIPIDVEGKREVSNR